MQIASWTNSRAALSSASMSGRASFGDPFDISCHLPENARSSNRSVGTLVEGEPVLLDEEDQPVNFVGVRALDQIGICSPLVRAIDGGCVVRGGDDDNRNGVELWSSANIIQELKARDTWQLQIQQHKGG